MSAEGGLGVECFEAAIAEAKKTFDVVQGDERTLLLDLDTPEAKTQYERVFPIVQEKFDVVSTSSWLSKSGNTHIAVTLAEPLSVTWRIALQAALGSDGVREVLGLKRYANGVIEPSMLFKPRNG